MSSVIIQAPTDEQYIAIEGIDHLGNDWDRPPFSDQYRFYAKAFFDRRDGTFHEFRIRIDHDTATSVQIDHFDLHARRCVRGDELAKLLGNRFWVLVGYQTKTDLGPIPRRDDCFAAFALVTPEQSVNIERGSGPAAFERGVTAFSRP